MQHVCQGCNQTFDSPYRTAKYCSRTCVHRHRHSGKERVCRTCGDALKSPGQIKLCYCSASCRDTDPNRTVIDNIVHTVCHHCEKAFTHPNWRTLDYCSQTCAKLAMRNVSIVASICDGCGKTFEHRSNQKRRFCTRDCWHKFSVGENNPTWNSVEVECANCHKTFPREAKHATKNNHNFCSSKCNGEYYSKIRVGVNHPLWKGGAENSRGPSWFRQRKKAWIRDNYTCKHCGKNKKQLRKNPDVHHINPFRNYGLDRHEEANRLENLICLCHACHMKAEAGLITFQLPLLNG